MAKALAKKKISAESEQEIYERGLLRKLPCLEKLNKSCNGKNIFLVHNNNGMVNQYRELALLLENRYNVYGIQARGLKPGTQMAESPWKMVDDYIEQITAFQKEGPYIVGGFCSGNSIAYEMAVRMGHLGLRVEKLLLLDSHLLVTDKSYPTIRMLKYLPAFVTKTFISWAEKTFKKDIEAQKNYIIKHPEADSGIEMSAAEISLTEKVGKNMDILLKYVLSFEIVNVPLLIPLAQDQIRPGATKERYERMTQSEAAIVYVPGVHNTILEKPNVDKLAEVIIDNL